MSNFGHGGNTPTWVVPSHFDSTGNTVVPASAADPLPVATSEGTTTAGSVTCSNVATGASAIVAAASATRRLIFFSNTGSVNIDLNNGAAADGTHFLLLPGDKLKLSAADGLAQLEWRSYSASAGNLSSILVEG